MLYFAIILFALFCLVAVIYFIAHFDSGKSHSGRQTFAGLQLAQGVITSDEYMQEVKKAEEEEAAK